MAVYDVNSIQSAPASCTVAHLVGEVAEVRSENGSADVLHTRTICNVAGRFNRRM